MVGWHHRRWTRVWASSWSWWWTGRPGMLQSMGSQIVRHDGAELNDWVYLFLFSGTHTWKQGHCINKQRKVYMYRHRYVCLCTQICIHARTYSLLQHAAAAAAVKSLQSCRTLCNPIDGSPPGSPVPGILQARTLEWVAISFSNAWKWKGKVKSLSRVRPSATPWTAAYQAPPSMGFSRQEYWSGVPLPSPYYSIPHSPNFVLKAYDILEIYFRNNWI